MPISGSTWAGSWRVRKMLNVRESLLLGRSDLAYGTGEFFTGRRPLTAADDDAMRFYLNGGFSF